MYSDALINTTTVRIYNIQQNILDKKLLKSNSLCIKTLVSSKGKIVFSRPVFFSIEHTKNGHYASSNELNIYAAYGINEVALRDDIYDEIVGQWENYANELTENLTSDAQKIKKSLRELVVLRESTICYA